MTGESMSRPSRRTTNPVNSQSTSATEDEDSATTGIQVSMEVATSSSLATFIKKLWIIVNDANLQSLIHWSDAGDVICIPNVTVFSKRVLPKYFKHGNWQSFVRQLNMYGFRRVYSPTPSPLTAHHTRTSAASTWPDQSGPMSMMLRSASSYQFMNENFVRDDSQKLVNIKRKAGSNRQTNAARQQKQQQQQQQQEQQQATDDTESQGQSQSQRGAANHVPISTEVAEQLQERVSHLLEQLTDTEKKLELMQSEAHSIKQIQIQQQQIQLDRCSRRKVHQNISCS
ncbi:HSF-type DNA-binding-domain-containing protein [Syncephalastrum racemosum]|uniref:HSF-type DNA-binding-domain-containing protein n=1 Tax=Syncephalastrum racemosum TaxID=13706 RepID=A0A1X2HA74_SYNRA|nr:HSF-type DNA-binding-domain-containing protein [Syncephalastrum racemosum]